MTKDHGPQAMSEHTNEMREKGREQEGEGLWRQFSGRIQEAWGALQDDDLDRYRGQRDQLIGKIQEKTGNARAEVARTLDKIATEIRYRFD